MTTTRAQKKGHKLETTTTRNGLLASCTCGEVYKNPAGVTGIWEAWHRDRIREAHQRHLAQA